MARGRQRREPHPGADRDGLAVTDRGAVERHLVLGVDVVRRAGALGQGEAAGDVVVVDVGLEHVGEPHLVFIQDVQDAVDVALRVDHKGDLAVVDHVAAVAEGGRLDRDDRQVGAHQGLLFVGWCSWNCASAGARSSGLDRPAASAPRRRYRRRRSRRRTRPRAGDQSSRRCGCPRRRRRTPARLGRAHRAGRPAAPSGISAEPGTWPATYSAGSRTSTTVAPSDRARCEALDVDLGVVCSSASLHSGRTRYRAGYSTANVHTPGVCPTSGFRITTNDARNTEGGIVVDECRPRPGTQRTGRDRRWPPLS